MVKVILGDEVKDSISGFTGIATGRAEYLTGCVQIQIASATLKGEPTDHWIDEQRLTIVEEAAYSFPEKAVKQAPAGPQNVPPARNP